MAEGRNQGSGDEVHLIEIGLDADVERVQIEGRSGNTGLNGCKPAKEFTLEERGKVKSVYCRRKVFWDVITLLVNAGHTSEVAIDKVYANYGRGS